jgi:hypothetical protein
MCLLNSEFLDQCPPLLLLRHQLDFFEEESEPFDHLCSYDLFEELEEHHFFFFKLFLLACLPSNFIFPFLQKGI